MILEGVTRIGATPIEISNSSLSGLALVIDTPGPSDVRDRIARGGPAVPAPGDRADSWVQGKAHCDR